MFELASWVWKSRPLTPGSLMSSTRQHGTSGNLCSNNSATEENIFGSRSTDRNKRPSASRSEGSSSTTRMTGASGTSIVLDGLCCVTRTSSRAEAGPTELQRNPCVRGSTNVHLGFDDQSANWSSSQVGPLARTALNFAQVGLTGNSSFFPAGK